MKVINSIVVALIFSLAGESFAATRIMQGNSIIGGKNIVVGANIYDVEFGFNPIAGWVVPEIIYPGPASVFSTRSEAAEALTAIYTQLIGNGAANPSVYTLVSIGGYYGHPEQKRFGIAQLYGDSLGPSQAKAVYANFVTEVLFAPGPTMVGTKADMSVIQDFGVPLIPHGSVEGYAFPVWTFKGTVAAVPEPSANILAGVGLLIAARHGARRRRSSRQ